MTQPLELTETLLTDYNAKKESEYTNFLTFLQSIHSNPTIQKRGLHQPYYGEITFSLEYENISASLLLEYQRITQLLYNGQSSEDIDERSLSILMRILNYFNSNEKHLIVWKTTSFSDYILGTAQFSTPSYYFRWVNEVTSTVYLEKPENDATAKKVTYEDTDYPFLVNANFQVKTMSDKSVASFKFILIEK